MNNAWSQENYIKACLFAANAHQGQRVPGTELPYLVHLSMVSLEVLAALPADRALDANLAVQCAWLHDTIEDTQTTYFQIEQAFGVKVADGVLALSKDAAVEKPLQMTDSLRRIRLQPREVWLVKLADRITNLQPPPAHWTKEKAAVYREQAIEICDALGEASELLSARLRSNAEAYKQFTA